MPNAGNFWADKEVEQLLKDYKNKGDVTDLQFSNEWGDKYGRSSQSVRCKLQHLRTTEYIGKPNKKQPKEKIEYETTNVEYGDDYINVVCASRRIRSQEDAIREFNIDLNEWRVVKCRIGTHEGYRKDRKVDWHVTDGRVTSGDVEDSGKMLVVPLYRVELRLERKVEEVRARDAIEVMLNDAKKFAPKYPKLNYTKHKDGCLYEVCIPDIHFGRLSWDRETGFDYDVQIAQDIVKKVVDDLLSYTNNFNISRILFPVGNDYFNVNSKDNTTVKGTPQQEDTRWQKTFVLGRKLAVEIIDACSSIAPVDVLVISGNHDEEKMFYMGDGLECWYNNNKNVTVDNSPRSRKYYLFGKNLIGLSHGCDVKTERLPLIMPLEVPDLWAQSTVREWHLGHIHTKKNMRFEEDESNGVLLRSLRSITAPDAWTFNTGLVGSVRAAESFLWKPEGGLIAQFTATP